MFGDRLYLQEGPSSTLSARIVCPGLMVHVTIRDAQASGLATPIGGMQITHVTSDTHDVHG